MPGDTPTEKALALRQQGLSNNQIIASLQREGFDTNQILDSLNQADLSEQTKGGNMANNNNPLPTGAPQEVDAGEQVYDENAPEKTEELVEAIIDEKWSDFMDNINRVVEWKDKTESRITEMESAMKHMKDDFDKLHTSVLDRVGEYDTHISDVGTEVKALEKVFQKVLPGFMENVAELKNITEAMKKNS